MKIQPDMINAFNSIVAHLQTIKENKMLIAELTDTYDYLDNGEFTDDILKIAFLLNILSQLKITEFGIDTKGYFIIINEVVYRVNYDGSYILPYPIGREE